MSAKPQRSKEERDQNGSPEPILETKLDAVAQDSSDGAEPDINPDRP